MNRPMIMTYTGKHIDLLDLRHPDIDIADIAHALSLANRFAGHSERPISVAHHSVYVSRLCHPYGRDVALQGLLHDASEAYLGDVTKWLKASPLFEGYRKMEDLVQGVIFRRFQVAEVMHPAVSRADKLMLRFEGPKAFGPSIWTRWADRINYTLLSPEEKQLVGPWGYWSHRQAEEAFLTEFALLSDLEGDYGNPVDGVRKVG